MDLKSETEAFLAKYRDLVTDPEEEGVLSEEEVKIVWVTAERLVKETADQQTAAYHAKDQKGGWTWGALRGYVETVMDRIERLNRNRAEYAAWDARKKKPAHG